jgi:hypothetical protein
MQHLRPSLLQLPPKHQPHILHQMACQLNMSHVRRMVLLPYIVALQNPRSIEIINITTRTLSSKIQRTVVEMLDHTFNLWLESAALDVRCA